MDKITGHKEGILSLQLSRNLNITHWTAWFMLLRIRNCFGIDGDSELDNEVEIDESYLILMMMDIPKNPTMKKINYQVLIKS